MIDQQLKAQRYPVAPWLYVCNYGRWQRHKKPAPDWIAMDTGLVTDPGKRAVWEALGPRGLETWLGVLVQAGREGTDGLFERDPLWLLRRLGLTAEGLTVLIDAGWLVCLTDAQAEVVRNGGDLETLDDQGGRIRAKEMFQRIAEGLAAIWGTARTSKKSEALYWRPTGQRGEQVRLAMHKRRRSVGTICDVIVSADDRTADASDIVVPLEKPIDPAVIVQEIVAAVGGSGERADEGERQNQTRLEEPHNSARNGDRANVPGKDVRPEKPHCSAKTRDSQTKTRKTGQDRTGQDRTGQGQDKTVTTDKTLGAPREACDHKASKRVSGQGTEPTDPPAQVPDTPEPSPQRPGPSQSPETRSNPCKPEAGRSGGVDRKRSHRASQASHGRRSGPQPIAHLVKFYWDDPDAVTLGWEVFRTLFPGRVDDQSDDAKSEVGMFAKLWVEEVKAVVDQSRWAQLRDKAIEKAIRVAKSKRVDSPGAAWTSLIRKSIAARASPGAQDA